MLRLIDAEELKHILNNSKYYGTKAGNAFADMITECKTIEERKKGRWIITDIYNYRVWHCNCSECGEDPIHFISGTEDWWLNKLPNFCPACGADNRGEKRWIT